MAENCQEEFTLPRRHFPIRADDYVRRGDRVFRIAQVLKFDSVMGIDVGSGRSAVLAISELEPADENLLPSTHTSLPEISADEDWREAQRRYAAIHTLIDRDVHGLQVPERLSKEFGVDVATLSHWLDLYRLTGSVLALAPQKRSRKPGGPRVDSWAETVIEQVIGDFYLTPERPTVQKAIVEVLRRCQERMIDLPSAGAIRMRISRIAERARVRGRSYKEQADYILSPAEDRFFDIDTTPLPTNAPNLHSEVKDFGDFA